MGDKIKVEVFEIYRDGKAQYHSEEINIKDVMVELVVTIEKISETTLKKFVLSNPLLITKLIYKMGLKESFDWSFDVVSRFVIISILDGHFNKNSVEEILDSAKTFFGEQVNKKLKSYEKKT